MGMVVQDFRLRDTAEYEEWYGQPHRAPELQVCHLYRDFRRIFDTRLLVIRILWSV